MKIPAYVVAVFIGVAILTVITAEWSEIRRGEICEPNQYTKQKECATYRVVPFIIVKLGKTLEHYLGAITFFLAIFTFFLWRSTGDLVRSAEATARETLNKSPDALS